MGLRGLFLSIITPYKNRAIDECKKVRVYRNLHAKNENFKYSVMQDKLVVGHTNKLLLKDCVFIVNKGGQNRVRKRNKKQVHAFVEGHVGEFDSFYLCNLVTYNPYVNDSFMLLNPGPEPVFKADMVVIQNQVSVVKEVVERTKFLV